MREDLQNGNALGQQCVRVWHQITPNVYHTRQLNAQEEIGGNVAEFEFCFIDFYLFLRVLFITLLHSRLDFLILF